MRLLDSPRLWVLFANLFTRAAGFTTSFLIARILGAHALGEYSVLVNTASTVIQPFLQVLGSNSTLLVAETSRSQAVSPSQLAKVSLLLAIVLSLISFSIFVMLHGFLLRNSATITYGYWFSITAASAIIFGHLCGAVLVGCYYGEGRFITSSSISIAVSAASLLFSIPAVLVWGLEGAYATITFASVALPAALTPGILFVEPTFEQTPCTRDNALSKVATQLMASLPSIARAAVGAFVFWLCTIYFVQKSLGIKGVGLIAVAMQWSTLMLMASSSWIGFAVKVLSDATGSRNAFAIRRATFRLLKQNLAVTLPVAVAVFLASGWIEVLYGLQDSGIDVLIRLNAICAVVLTCNTIFEQLLLCLRRQSMWFLYSIFGFLAQALITGIFINAGLFIVILGWLAGSVVVFLCCFISLDKIINNSLEDLNRGAIQEVFELDE